MLNLFHCVPGGASKYQAFRTHQAVLTDGGVRTGCVIPGRQHTNNWFTWVHMKLFNWLGAFNNWEDTRQDIEEAIQKAFAEVETRMVGLVLLFRARQPRRN
jgi:hypothetical protein